ncbi:hypothetical protein JTB14_023364 [Gonioctena quinquepunctata]|nr:hypothetical protein JTB14_023364 [Gonioctena quinquepunctata]
MNKNDINYSLALGLRNLVLQINLDLCCRWNCYLVFQTKKQLKGSSIMITEVLTATNLEISEPARELYDKSTWTSGGLVHVSNAHAAEHEVKVFSSNWDFDHLANLATQLRGVGRKLLKKEMLNVKALEQRQNDILKLDDATLHNSNQMGFTEECAQKRLRKMILESNRLCHVVEMVLCEHDGGSRGAWLLKFRSFCEDNKKWPAFRKVVTDFSKAFSNAVFISFNALDSKEYINLTFHCVFNNKEFPRYKIQLHICCFHMFELMARDVDEYYEDPAVGKHFEEILASAYNIDDWEVFRVWFKNLYIITHSNNRNGNFLNAFRSLLKISFSTDTFTEDPEKDQPILDLNITTYGSTLCCQYFKQMLLTYSLDFDHDKSQEN